MAKKHLVSELNPKELEQLFLAVLKSHLVLNGYVVAIPETDLGENLWFAARADRLHDKCQSFLYRAQLKSVRLRGAQPTDQQRRSRSRRRDTNDIVRTLDYAQCQQGFVYFFGLHDEGLGQSIGEQFHIGCVPAAYWTELRRRYPDAGVRGDRFEWQFKVIAWNSGERQFVCNVRRGANFDVTAFFRDIEFGLRVSDGREPFPELRIIPDRDGGKRRAKHLKRRLEESHA